MNLNRSKHASFQMDITENSDNFRCFSNNQRLVQEQLNDLVSFVKVLLDIQILVFRGTFKDCFTVIYFYLIISSFNFGYYSKSNEINNKKIIIAFLLDYKITVI